MALPSLFDMWRGQWRAMRHGTGNGWNPFENYAFAKQVQQEREAKANAHAAAQRGTHKGGWHPSQHGFIDGRPVTFALGWGTREGETMLADGHLSPEEFRNHADHNHYGSGKGPNDNVKDRGKYSGPGA